MLPDEAGRARKRKEHSSLLLDYCSANETHSKHRFFALSRSHFKHDVMLARMRDHLQAEIILGSHFGDRRMIDLQGLDLLGEIGGVSPDVNHIADPRRSTGFELHGRDRKVAVIVGDDADALLRRNRRCRPTWRRT